MAGDAVTLRPMLPQDGPVLAALFALSIGQLTGDDYSPAQRAAWAAMAEDDEQFATRLQKLLTLVAVRAGDVVGFAALKAPDHLEMVYVRPDAARRGVAHVLLHALETLAGARGAKQMTVNASDTAQPFFAKQGYAPVRRETVPLGDEWLGRTVMRKSLTPAPSGAA